MSFVSRITNYLVKQVDLDKKQVIFSLVERNPDAKLLDCGCGSGEFTLKVAERIGTRKVYGIEIAEESSVKAKMRGIEIHQGDLNRKFPFKDRYFDIVLASASIEHLCNTDFFIKEIYRVLKIGSYAVIQTPNLAAFYNIFYLLFGKQPYVAMVSDEILAGTWFPLKSSGIKRDEPAHRRVFTPGALKQLLEYHGFQVEKSIGSGFLPFPSPLSKVLCFIDKSHAVNITVKVRKGK